MRNKSKKSIKTLNEFISYFAIGSLVFLGIGLKNIDNYLDWLTFPAALCFTGTIFGVIVYFIISYFIPNTRTYKNAKGIGILFPLTFGFALVFFGLGSIFNESLNQNSECKEYSIDNLGVSGSRPRVHYVFIRNGNKTERVSFGSDIYKTQTTGGNINLCIITGRLGFQYYKVQSDNQVKTHINNGGNK